MLLLIFFFSFCFMQAAYLRIYFKLRYRFAQGFVSREEQTQNSSRRQLRGRRLQRTNLLLISIAVIFCISWLPMNLFNVIADFPNIPAADFTTQTMRVYYALCHMMGMSSACSNPVLYGWLNENFWKEFKDIMCMSGSSNEDSNDAHRLSTRKSSKNILNRGKPDLVTDFHQGTTVNTEMSVLTKC